MGLKFVKLPILSKVNTEIMKKVFNFLTIEELEGRKRTLVNQINDNKIILEYLYNIMNEISDNNPEAKQMFSDGVKSAINFFVIEQMSLRNNII